MGGGGAGHRDIGESGHRKRKGLPLINTDNTVSPQGCTSNPGVDSGVEWNNSFRILVEQEGGGYPSDRLIR
jgi:hypothetical protein